MSLFCNCADRVTALESELGALRKVHDDALAQIAALNPVTLREQVIATVLQHRQVEIKKAQQLRKEQAQEREGRTVLPAY